ncbi:energy transducer TonB [Saccharicrinis sp. 156]|uniref:energy transducer TonB n=1 Tax=Saccharicrinis sp. 156 TaxID=3417574 RepID=UPI003D327CB0
MKRIILATCAMLIACLSFAQMTRLSENIVESPKFNGTSSWYYDDESDCSSICQYLKYDLEGNANYSEGVVNVLFTINADGTLSNFTIKNSVSSATDNAVLKSIESTSGMWRPGMVNGTPAQMQREIFISFYDPAHGTLKEQGNANLQIAVKKYHAAVNLKNSLTLSEARALKKANNKLKSAIKLLETAERFLPSEPSVVFWQAATYEQVGNEMLKTEKLNEFESLLDPAYQAQIELVDISL